MNSREKDDRIESLEIDLNKDLFMRELIKELSSTIEDIIGLEEASGFISIVGKSMGSNIDSEYKRALKINTLTRDQVSDVLVDLKKRISGDFYIIEEDEEKIILGNRSCPFGSKVIGHPAMCMMTSNVFGAISSKNLGYSKVAINKAIANGDSGCRVVVYLKDNEESRSADGREYFGE